METFLLHLSISKKWICYCLYTHCLRFSKKKRLRIQASSRNSLQVSIIEHCASVEGACFSPNHTAFHICLLLCIVVQYVRLTLCLCEGNKINVKKKKNQKGKKRKISKTVAEQDLVSKMKLEGSPSSLHLCFSLIIDPEENKLNPC